MRRLVAYLVCLFVATTAYAQDDDPSYIEGLIQDALSDTSRDVRVIGFRGALSSNATMEQLTIADDQGIWLSLEDASLVWSRAALLRGRLKIDELTAGRIELVRVPQAEPTVSTEDTEAQPFALPELPISIELGELRADRVILGEAVLGEPATLSVNGNMSLIDGAADIAMTVQRTDRNDTLDLVTAFANDTRILKIDLDFDESAGGLVSRAMGVPGEPALGLRILGDAPLTEFTAQIALSSDGIDRFGGTVGIGADETAEPGAYTFSADLSGDLRPLVTQDLHPFFGAQTTLATTGETFSDGGLSLDRLAMTSGALSLTGNLRTSAEGLPTEFALNGRIAGEDGPIRLPTTAPATLVDTVTIAAQYDAADGDEWSAEFRIVDLERDGLAISNADLVAVGQIIRGEAPTLVADTTFRLQNLRHTDPALAEAIGTNPEGRLLLSWQEKQPIDVTRLELETGNTQLIASGQIDSLAKGLPVTGRALLKSDDISRFAAISGRPLSGAANLEVEGSATPLSGAFDATIAGSTVDLVIGEARVDPLMRGRSTLDIAARRDETGTVLEALSLRNAAIEADANGRLNTASGSLAFVGTLADLSLVEPKLSGPADIDSKLAWQADGGLDLERLELTALNAEISANGRLETADPNLPANGTLRLKAEDISRLAELLGRPLAGQVDLSLDGSGAIKTATIDGTVALEARNLRTGVAQVDSITGGSVSLDANLAYGDRIPFINALTLITQNLTATAKSTAPGAPVNIDTRLKDLALLAPGINGPASLKGTVTPRDATGQAIDLDLNFAGPSGVAASIAGQVRDAGQDMALSIRGSAPLSLANAALSPNSIRGPLNFDLRVDGAPALSSLSGQVSFNDARMALPTANIAINNLSGTVALAGGQATPNVSGNLGAGGRFQVTGPITLTAPYQANLTTTLTALGLSDPTLYETTVNGTVNVTGPLTGGALISGALALGRTELRVPSGGASAAGAPEGIRHIAEPASVRRTRARAGLIETGKSSGPTVAFPLDLTISAPNQIFVRGRGLDAELGGQLRLGRTTTNVTASGVFELIRGRIDVLTKRLDLTEGLVDLRGALDPYLRFVAETQSNEYSISIVLEGLASEPTVSFTSSPDLPQEEILAQLLFGRSFSDMSALQAAQLVSAVATLSGKGSGGLTGKLRNSLGLSDFDVSSTADGATQFSAGTYISDNVYSEVVADSDGNNQINLNLDLTPSLTVKGSAGNDGNTGLGIFFEKDY
jgi:translocation and assembly module TamB